MQRALCRVRTTPKSKAVQEKIRDRIGQARKDFGNLSAPRRLCGENSFYDATVTLAGLSALRTSLSS
jgi:hypothetical protein